MYYSHVRDDGARELVIDHLHEVAEMASNFGRLFGAENWAYNVGISHDIGKYSKEFQRRLLDNGHKVDHSTAGAYELAKTKDILPAYCVAGHHGGLPDGGSKSDSRDDPTLQGRIKRGGEGCLPRYDDYSQDISLQRGTPPIWLSSLDRSSGLGFTLSFLTRMLYSCLVDADFLCTERFMDNCEREKLSDAGLDTLLCKLETKVQTFFPPSNELNIVRCDILKKCQAVSQNKPGLFSLTVPTGGGKTYASMYFALNHAAVEGHNFNRVIYVIPYTSIIEQNAQVFREVFGEKNVLEHHASFDFDDQDDVKVKSDDSSQSNGQNPYRLATENWDAPVVVTTNVQFFESFYAHKSSRCRKLHNIANSIIVLDEAQMLPSKNLKPCIAVLSELVKHYGCTVVLCTATQPSLDTFFDKHGLAVTEIVLEKNKLFEILERVEYRTIGTISDKDLANKLSEEDQVLCIVNSRKQAKHLFELVKGEGTFHLSTLMYPKHREAVFDTIRLRLMLGQECRVISTSLVEAGVDLDFPVVYRAFSGVDSMIQAAGRCNREGRNPAQCSPVFLFEPEDNYALPSDIKQTAAIGRKAVNVSSANKNPDSDTNCNKSTSQPCDIGSPRVIEEYFKELYELRDNNLDAKNVYGRLENIRSIHFIPFRQISSDFKMIDEGSYPIIIPTDTNAELLKVIHEGFPTVSVMRRLMQYVVSVYKQDRDALYRSGAIEPLLKNQDDQTTYILNDSSYYSNESGLCLDVEEGIGVFL